MKGFESDFFYGLEKVKSLVKNLKKVQDDFKSIPKTPAKPYCCIWNYPVSSTLDKKGMYKYWHDLQ